MIKVGIIGTGFVADLYMRSIQLGTNFELVGAFDRRPERLAQFCAFWKQPAFTSQDELLSAIGPGGIVLNLTNPSSHFEIGMAGLEAGCHVYTEKPLATTLKDAKTLCDQARESNLMLASAPCSFLGEAAQTVGAAIRENVAGKVRAIYAELDDGFIPQARYADWISESGAPWPAGDEFEVGCTLEHAGYYLTWLISIFGSIRSVVAASSRQVCDLLPVDAPAPDFSVATLFFESGVVARLTCTIIGPHNHSLRIVGDRGVIELDEAWNNTAKVRFRRRFNLRRRLMESPIAKRLKLPGETHPKVGRWGSASMNFALGVTELADALVEKRASRMSIDLALHLTEVTLAIQDSEETTGAQRMTTRCDPLEPMPWAQKLG
ncbi:Gfo/Idh/MocA family oxidoreductase [uncultured Roseovarius sp.]|uniref:Gfo/Idh/MocA family protein n=1 Tax=uncultured Roseovarius sp. TaxID=293344 RepID=UPI002616E74A|nr:Gfo/Idh/MocA family oxidoreductase [uncultured Roseovarius sp.]